MERIFEIFETVKVGGAGFDKEMALRVSALEECGTRTTTRSAYAKPILLTRPERQK